MSVPIDETDPASLQSLPTEIHFLISELLLAQDQHERKQKEKQQRISRRSRANTPLPSEIPSAIRDFISLGATSRALNAVFSTVLYRAAAQQLPGLLFWATACGLDDIVGKLLKSGADPNRAMILKDAGKLDTTRLGDQLKSHHYFLHQYDKVEWSDPWKKTALPESWAVMTPTFDLGAGQRKSWDTPFGHTFFFPIHLASLGGHTASVTHLIEHGAQLQVPSRKICCKAPNILPSAGGWFFVGGYEEPSGQVQQYKKYPLWTPSHLAVCNHHREVFDALAGANAPDNASFNHMGITLLHNAAAAGDTSLVEYFIEKGQDVHLTDAFNLSPIWHAYLMGQWDAIKCLITHGADIDDDLGWGYTPLVDACVFGDFDGACRLVDLGADVHVACMEMPEQIQDRAWMTPRGPYSLGFKWSMSRDQHQPIVKGLRPLDLACLPCSQGLVNVGRRNCLKTEPTPDVHRERLVRKLLRRGASTEPSPFNVLGEDCQYPPLVIAAGSHQLRVMLALLEGGAPVSAASKQGVNALHAVMGHSAFHCRSHTYAPTFPHCQRPNRLQVVHDDINPQWLSGNELEVETPCRKQQILDCVSLLLDHGINFNAKDRAGYSPHVGLVYSAGPDHPIYQARLEIFEMLIQRGADPNAGLDETPREVIVQVGKPRSPDTVFCRLFGLGHLEACQTLIDHGLNIQEDDISTAFHGLARSEHFSTKSFSFLCEMDTYQQIGEDPKLLLGALLSKSDLLWSLMLHKSRYNLPQLLREPFNGSSFLHEALLRNLPEPRIRGLLHRGADVNLTDEKGYAAISLAITRNSHIDLLLQYGAKVHISDYEEVEEGWDNLKWILEHAKENALADFDWKEPRPYRRETRNPLLQTIRLSSAEGRTKILKALLVAQPLTAKVPDDLHFEYLREACRFQDTNTLTLLLRSGVNPNAAARHGTGHTALWWMLVHRKQMLNFMFGRGKPVGNLEKRKRLRGNSFVLAYCTWLPVKYENLQPWIDYVEILLRSGADPTIKTESGKRIGDYLDDVMCYGGCDRLLVRLRQAVRPRWKVGKGLGWRETGLWTADSSSKAGDAKIEAVAIRGGRAGRSER
ncbi:ankyrin repeat-containing domain protein [Bombardia bombarda]|uniref:Ankyrin repeat-containing domain protein n=1 Tax=Bombardia bombarda TaxID=252184 RepID=A0AA39X0T5_9PEZI|nr:ankyrin repeat-containing domain protein [Bombardia bombarda]